MDKNIIFTDEEDDTLIYLVSQHALLYDLNEEDYRNQLKKDKVWNAVATILNKNGDSCRKRWKNIKDTYYRQKRKNKSSNLSAGPKNPRSKFKKYANLLSFLEAVPKKKTTINNIEHDESTSEDVQMPEQLNECLENLTENRQTNSSLVTDISSPKSAMKYLKSNQNYPYCHENEDDELISFSNHLRSILKKLPPILRIKAKKELYDVLTKYEFLSLDYLEQACSPSHTTSFSASSLHSPGYIVPEPGSQSPEQDTKHSLAAPSIKEDTNSSHSSTDI